MSISGPIAAAAIGAVGSGVAGGEQASAAEKAQQLQAQEQQQALQFEEQQYNTTQSEEAPFLGAGTKAVNSLSQMLPSLTSPYPGGSFTAPTLAQAEAQPGYKFTLEQGLQALNNQGAANGSLLSPETQLGDVNYAENAAENDYQTVYNNSLNTYATNYNTWANQQANTYNRYAGLAGMGQQTANTLGQLGANTAQQVSNTLLQGGAQQAQDIQNAGAATASGYVGATNALSTGLTSTANNLSLQQMLAYLQGGSSSTAINPYASETPTEYSIDPTTGGLGQMVTQ